MSFLSDVGDVLQAPKNALWSVIPGLHDDSGNAYSGSQVAHNLVGTDEDSVWGKALGLGIDVAGDPLTWAAPLIGRGVGAAARGLGFLGDTAGAGASVAADAGAATDALAGAMKSAEPLASAWDAALPAAAGSDGGSAAAMLPLRRRFGMVKNVTPIPQEPRSPSELARMMEVATGNYNRLIADPNLMFAGEMTGPIENKWLMQKALGQDAGQVGGAYYPQANMGFAQVSPTTSRHEIIHGIIDQAAKTGNTQGLPWAMKIPAMMQGSENTFVDGLSYILNEAAAHGGQYRGTMPQVGGYLNFLLNPDTAGRAMYANQFKSISPTMGAAYSALPYAAAGGLAAGTAAAAYPLFGG